MPGRAHAEAPQACRTCEMVSCDFSGNHVQPQVVLGSCYFSFAGFFVFSVQRVIARGDSHILNDAVDGGVWIALKEKMYAAVSDLCIFVIAVLKFLALVNNNNVPLLPRSWRSPYLQSLVGRNSQQPPSLTSLMLGIFTITLSTLCPHFHYVMVKAVERKRLEM